MPYISKTILPASLLVSLSSINARVRNRLILFTIARSFLNVFDVLAAALMASIVMSLTAQISLGKIEPESSLIEKWTGIQLDIKLQAGIVVVLMLVKPLISMPTIYFTSRTLHDCGAKIASSTLTDIYALQPWQVGKLSISKTNQAVTIGLESMVAVLLNGMNFVSDLSLLMLFSISIFVVSPSSTLIILIYLVSIFVLMSKVTGKNIAKAGKEYAKLQVTQNRTVTESILAFRDLVIAQKSKVFLNDFGTSISRTSRLSAKVDALNQIPRIMVEIALALALFTVVIVLSGSNSLASTAGVLTFYVASLMRMLPAIGPLQSSLNSIRNLEGRVRILEDVLEDIQNWKVQNSKIPSDLYHYNVEGTTAPFTGTLKITIRNLTVSLSNNSKSILSDVNLEMEEGGLYAVAGESGSGKSTLIDCILGLVTPSEGSITAAGLPLKSLRENGSLSFAYVSQDVPLIAGSLRENIDLYVQSQHPEEYYLPIKDALELSQLDEFVETLPDGLDTYVEERGSNLSGGQRQRIGIARALRSRAKIIVFDEPTSALDAINSVAIMDSIKKLKGNSTVIVVTHDLNILESFEKIFFIENGQLICSGDYQKLLDECVNFQRAKSVNAGNSLD